MIPSDKYIEVRKAINSVRFRIVLDDDDMQHHEQLEELEALLNQLDALVAMREV